MYMLLLYFITDRFLETYLVDPASSHTLFFKIKPCMSKCSVFYTLDCIRLIITVIVLLVASFSVDNRGNSTANTCKSCCLLRWYSFIR